MATRAFGAFTKYKMAVGWQCGKMIPLPFVVVDILLMACPSLLPNVVNPALEKIVTYGREQRISHSHLAKAEVKRVHCIGHSH